MINRSLLKADPRDPHAESIPNSELSFVGASKIQNHIRKKAKYSDLTWRALMQFIKQMSQTFILQTSLWL